MDHCYDNSFTFFPSEQHHECTQYEYTRHASVFFALYFLSLCIQRKDFIAIALVRLALSAHKALENVFNDLVWVNSEFKTDDQVAPGQSGNSFRLTIQYILPGKQPKFLTIQ
jgi:hypothetical protein